jgi:type IV pilus assembly protein PilN
MRLDINLASRPYEDAKEFWQRWGVGLVLTGIVTLFLVGFTVWKWHNAAKDRAAVGALEHNIAVLDGKLAKSEATLNRPENRTLREQSNYLNNLFQQKAFSWTLVFEDLERVMPPRLHVVSIRPEIDASNQLEIKLTVAGESHDRALDLVRKMEDSRHFQQTHILDERSGHASQNGGVDDVLFNISALYIPDSVIVRQGAAH